MSDYRHRKGVSAERAFVAFQRSRGRVAFRSPGSKGAVDVIVLQCAGTTNLAFVKCYQIKSGLKPSAVEVDRLKVRMCAETGFVSDVAVVWARPASVNGGLIRFGGWEFEWL